MPVEPNLVEVRHPRVLLASVAFSFNRDGKDISFAGVNSAKRRAETSGYRYVISVAPNQADCDTIGTVAWAGQHAAFGWHQISYNGTAVGGTLTGTTNHVIYPFNPLYIVYSNKTKKLSAASNSFTPLLVSDDVVDSETDAQLLIPMLTRLIRGAVQLVDKWCSDTDHKVIADVMRKAASEAGYGSTHVMTTSSTTVVSNNNLYTRVVNGF